MVICALPDLKLAVSTGSGVLRSANFVLLAFGPGHWRAGVFVNQGKNTSARPIWVQKYERNKHRRSFNSRNRGATRIAPWAYAAHRANSLCW